MSLISDALRKARQETTGRDAEGRGLRVPPGWDRQSSGSRLGAGLVLGAAIALAAALGGAAVVWWAIGQTDDDQGAARLEGVADVEGEAKNVGEDEPGGELDDAGPLIDGLSDAQQAPQPVSPVDEPNSDLEDGHLGARSEVVDVDREGSEGGPPEAADAGEMDPVATESPSSPSPPDSPPGTRVFVVDADLGHTTLTLDFVVFRPDDPFAEINGLEVHVGSTIDGYLVEEITRDHVRLSGEGGEIILRVR